MNEQVKAWVNRIGLGAVVVGIVGISIAGGDADAAVSTGFQVATFVGAAVILIKEIIQSLKK